MIIWIGEVFFLGFSGDGVCGGVCVVVFQVKQCGWLGRFWAERLLCCERSLDPLGVLIRFVDTICRYE